MKTTFKLGLGLLLSGAAALMSAQNSSYDANTIPISGGNANCAFGFQAMLSNSSGMNCTAMGFGAMQNNVNGFANTGIGETSMFNNDGNENTAVGSDVMSQATNASFNTALGRQALILNNGDHNTATGWIVMNANTTGIENCAYGSMSMLTNITGNSNSTYGYMADVSASNLSNATAVGAGAVVNASNRVWLGTVADDVWGNASFIISDKRFKSSVKEDDVKGLEFIKLLRPVAYNFESKKFTEHITSGMADNLREKHLGRDFTKATQIRQSGFLAQEVEEAAKKSGYNFNGVHTPEGEFDTYGLSYSTFVVPLVKAVQEQQKMIEELQRKLAVQEEKATAATGAVNLDAGLAGFSMFQNEPNPFSHETVIRYTLPQQVSVASMNVYDLSGKQVKTFALTEKGAASIVMSSDRLAAGIYIYSIIADGKVMDSKRMIVADK